MQEAARKMGVQPTKPEGYDSLYAKYAPDDDQEFDANILGTLNQATGSVDTFENGSIFPPPNELMFRLVLLKIIFLGCLNCHRF